jgi:phage tail sheath protein FI
MSEKFIAPGVKRVEKDVSEVVTPSSTSIGGMVGQVSKGIANSRTLITRDRDFYSTFGTPVSGFSSEYAYYAAGEFLKESSQMWFIRPTFGDEDYANKIFSNSASVSGVSATTINATQTASLLTQSGYEDGNKVNDIYDIESSTATGFNDLTLTVASIGPGTYGQNVGVSIITCASEETQNLFDWGYLYDDAESNGAKSSATDAVWKKVYKINVYEKPEDQGESYFTSQGGISATPIESFLVSNYPTLKDSTGKTLYAPEVVNGNSSYIYVKTTDSTYPINTTQVYALENGVDSTTGTTVGDKKEAWKLFYDREKVDVNILLCPEEGSSGNATIANQVATVASSRRDCIAVVQVGSKTDTTAQSIVTAFNAGSYSFPLQSYVACYGGYDLVYDSFTDKRIYIPKAIFGASLMARTDNIANTWDAPAGLNRGIISSIGQLNIFNTSEIGYLYDNNINTSKIVRGVGNVMWGQKTAQRKASALDRINVRRLLLFIENSVEPLLLAFLFEANTEKTRSRVDSIITSFMSGVQAGGGVTSYDVICDDTNNTAQVIDNNQLNVDIYVQPTKTIEYIKLQLIITRTGVNFTEV